MEEKPQENTQPQEKTGEISRRDALFDGLLYGMGLTMLLNNSGFKFVEKPFEIIVETAWKIKEAFKDSDVEQEVKNDCEETEEL
ncbi:hypothetical protein HZA39_01105, partial [Candidatus Peregrinibacteria bacterium]|nr:hypothetical protein [Candidatus Peregrinibacteria bacterium]